MSLWIVAFVYFGRKGRVRKFDLEKLAMHSILWL